ncbi:MAG: permease [Deltaproteobacteria bacterium]|nr:permease [Deltaproteobacteria bacterium]
MLLLLASFAALGIGPALVVIARSRPWALDAADGFAVVAILGITLFHVLPEAFATGGPWAALAMIAGIVAPLLLETKGHATNDHPTRHARFAPALALAGLAVHGLVDGVALAGDARAIGIAIVLHRIPEGVAAWTISRPAFGARWTLAALGGLALATSFGVLAGKAGLPLAGGMGPAIVQAVAMGSVLHVVLHHAPRNATWTHHHDHVLASSDQHPHPAHPATPGHSAGLHVASALGAAAGAVAVAVLPLESGNGATGARTTFVRLAAASAPWLLAAVVAAGFLAGISARTFERVATRSGRVLAVVRAVLMAPLLPVCSCGVRPLYERMIERKAHAVAALAVLVSAACLGPATILLSLGLLGWQLTLARCAGALLIATFAGLGATRSQGEGTPSLPPAAPMHLRWRLGPALETVDYTGAWLIAGLACAAVIAPLATRIAGAPGALVVGGLALAGLPGYVSAAGATPFAAVLIESGVSPGAALAFVLTGPCANIDTIRLVARRHGLRASAWFAGSATCLAVAAGLAYDALVPASPPANSAAAGGLVSVIALVIVSGLLTISVVRHGPRHLLSQLVSQVAREY